VHRAETHLFGNFRQAQVRVGEQVGEVLEPHALNFLLWAVTEILREQCLDRGERKRGKLWKLRHADRVARCGEADVTDDFADVFIRDGEHVGGVALHDIRDRHRERRDGGFSPEHLLVENPCRVASDFEPGKRCRAERGKRGVAVDEVVAKANDRE